MKKLLFLFLIPVLNEVNAQGVYLPPAHIGPVPPVDSAAVKPYFHKRFVAMANWASGPEGMTTLDGQHSREFSVGTVWECVSVRRSTPKFNETTLVLRGQNGEMIPLPLRLAENRAYVYPKPVYDMKRREYGDKFWRAVLQKRVEPGMTQEMCREAWGKADDTSETRTADATVNTWLYKDGRGILFLNGKADTITEPE